MTTTGYPPNESPDRDGAISVRRYVNEEIARTARSFAVTDDSEFEFICECGDLRCTHPVRMSLGEYRLSAPGSVVGH